MKSKLLASALLATSVLSLVACGADKQQTKKLDTQKVEKSSSSAKKSDTSKTDSSSSNTESSTSKDESKSEKLPSKFGDDDIKVRAPQADTSDVTNVNKQDVEIPTLNEDDVHAVIEDGISRVMTSLSYKDGNPRLTDEYLSDVYWEKVAGVRFSHYSYVEGLAEALNKSSKEEEVWLGDHVGEDGKQSSVTAKAPSFGDQYIVTQLNWKELKNDNGLAIQNVEVKYRAGTIDYTSNLTFEVNRKGQIVGVA